MSYSIFIRYAQVSVFIQSNSMWNPGLNCYFDLILPLISSMNVLVEIQQYVLYAFFKLKINDTTSLYTGKFLIDSYRVKKEKYAIIS